MHNLFFYGTLRHLPLLEIVLGRPRDAFDASPAVLTDHSVQGVAEGPFPMISTAAGERAQGVLLRDLSTDDLARLNFYEGSFEYDLRDVVLAEGQGAQVYFPTPGAWTAQEPWDFDAWCSDWGAATVIAAREVMGYFGSRSREEVAVMFPVIRARAASTLRARSSRHGRETFRGDIDITARSRPYSNFFAVDDLRLRHARFDGTLSDELERAVFMAADAALVLPYDPQRDAVLVVEQIRMGPIARGDRTAWQIEPIAGRIDPGETPEQAARREAIEEAGLTLQTLETIAEVYPSPGTSSEFYYVFLGIADLPDSAAGLGGLAAEGEDIRSHILSFDTLMQRVAQCDVVNAPLITAAYYLSHHRERLRSEGAAGTPNRS